MMHRRDLVPGLLIAALLALSLVACRPAGVTEAQEKSLARLPGAVTDLIRPVWQPSTLVATVDRGAGLYRSDDGGATWTATRKSGELAAYQLLELPEEQALLAATNLGIWRSDQELDRWEWMLHERLGAFALSLDAAGHPFAALHSAVAVADAGGRRWVAARGRIDAGGLLTLARASNRPGNLFAGTNTTGIWETGDAGRTWQPRFPTRAVVSRIVRPADGAFVAIAGQTLLRWRDHPTEPEVVVLSGIAGRPLALAVAGDVAYAGTASGEIVRLAGDGQQVIDRLPDPVTALRVIGEELCAGTATGLVHCRTEPGAGG